MHGVPVPARSQCNCIETLNFDLLNEICTINRTEIAVQSMDAVACIANRNSRNVCKIDPKWNDNADGIVNIRTIHDVVHMWPTIKMKWNIFYDALTSSQSEILIVIAIATIESIYRRRKSSFSIVLMRKIKLNERMNWPMARVCRQIGLRWREWDAEWS